MDHTTVRNRRWFLGLGLSTAALACSGCNMVATALYVLNGTNVPADFDGLKGKRIVVVCRPITSLQYNNSSVARDLAKQVGALLKKNVQKVHVIDQREVSQWTDENDWEEYHEIGKALNAEVVVGIDLEEFSLYKGQTLFQGKANLTVFVYDVGKEKEPIWEKPLPQVHYPPNSAIPVDKPEAEFRRQFVASLAEQIARHFYDHDATVDFASDPTAVN